MRNHDKIDRLSITGLLAIFADAIFKVSGVEIANDELTALAIGQRTVAAGSTLTLTKAAHGSGRTVLFDTVAGSTVTLPAATGSGVRFRCLVSVLATSNSHSLVADGTDEFVGTMTGSDSDTSDATTGFVALVGDDFDVIAFNRTTTGIAGPGDYMEVEDIVSGVWQVNGVFRATGAIATPFSST